MSPRTQWGVLQTILVIHMFADVVLFAFGFNTAVMSSNVHQRTNDRILTFSVTAVRLVVHAPRMARRLKLGHVDVLRVVPTIVSPASLSTQSSYTGTIAMSRERQPTTPDLHAQVDALAEDVSIKRNQHVDVDAARVMNDGRPVVSASWAADGER